MSAAMLALGVGLATQEERATEKESGWVVWSATGDDGVTVWVGVKEHVIVEIDGAVVYSGWREKRRGQVIEAGRRRSEQVDGGGFASGRVDEGAEGVGRDSVARARGADVDGAQPPAGDPLADQGR